MDEPNGGERRSDAALPSAQIDRVFDAPDLRPVERWVERAAADQRLQIEQRLADELDDSYLDSADRRLLRAGYSLHLHRRDGNVIAAFEKLSGETGEPPRERLEADPARGLVADESLFGGRLWALVGSRPLSERIDLHRRRTVLRLRAASAELALVLEQTAIPLDGDERPVTLDRVRVVGTGADCASLTGELAAACALRPATTTRFQTAIASIGVTLPHLPGLGSEIVGRGQLAGETAFAVLRTQFRRMVAEEPGTRLGDDLEALHDMRVAIRRQRAAIRLFRELLPPKLARAASELRWVGRALGEVRDLDVQRATLERWNTEIDPADRPALESLGEWLVRRRSAARRKMLRLLETRRYARLVERMAAWLKRGPARRGSAPRLPILQYAPTLIAQRYGRVIKLGRKIDAASPPDAYHRLRIRCKALRYALEFHAPLYGKPARRLIDELVRLQDLLGDHQDADVAMQWLEEIVRDRGKRLGPRTVFVVGKLAERYAARAKLLRSRFPKRFRGIRGKSWSRFALEMRRVQSTAPGAATRRSRPTLPPARRPPERAP